MFGAKRDGPVRDGRATGSRVRAGLNCDIAYPLGGPSAVIGTTMTPSGRL
jgi:hypothetical protein